MHFCVRFWRVRTGEQQQLRDEFLAGRHHVRQRGRRAGLRGGAQQHQQPQRAAAERDEEQSGGHVSGATDVDGAAAAVGGVAVGRRGAHRNPVHVEQPGQPGQRRQQQPVVVRLDARDGHGLVHQVQVAAAGFVVVGPGDVVAHAQPHRAAAAPPVRQRVAHERRQQLRATAGHARAPQTVLGADYPQTEKAA